MNAASRDSSLESFGIEGEKSVRNNRSRELEGQGKSPQTLGWKDIRKLRGEGQG